MSKKRGAVALEADQFEGRSAKCSPNHIQRGILRVKIPPADYSTNEQAVDEI